MLDRCNTAVVSAKKLETLFVVVPSIERVEREHFQGEGKEI